MLVHTDCFLPILIRCPGHHFPFRDTVFEGRTERDEVVSHFNVLLSSLEKISAGSDAVNNSQNQNRGGAALLTEFHCLFVVPVAVVVNHRVLAMAEVHLADMRAELVGFWPIMFRRLTVEMANTFHVRRPEKVGARILMTLHVKGGYTPPHLLDPVQDIRKMFFETLLQMHDILTGNIVCCDFIDIIGFDLKFELEGLRWLMVPQRHCERVVRVRKPDRYEYWKKCGIDLQFTSLHEEDRLRTK